MNVFRSMLFGAVALAGASFGATIPAQADTGFYIGPNGARIYYNDYDDDHRPYGRFSPYRSCHNEVSYGWLYGERVRIVDRVCYSRFGGRYIADRDYYPVGGYDWNW